MKANYSKLLTKIAGILGITGASLLITLPSLAQEVTNPHPEKSSIKSQLQIAQSSGNGILNPRPSIFNEPPYNGRRAEPADVPTKTTPDMTEPGMTQPTPEKEPPQATESKNVIEVAETAGSFKTLLKAVEAAGLTETLKGPGPFTIFAPTDQAFAKLPQDAVQDLLKPENKEILVKILTYHVVPGKVMSTDLKEGPVTTVQGEPMEVKITPQGVFANDGKVTQADIPASNGVIHVIDNLILPPSL
jgi:uncharacterized surface protein with fasciclin (FAS1) repeats